MDPLYSVIIPIKNEEENIAPLIDEVEGVMKTLAAPWELLCIDDGSTDGSLLQLKELSMTRPYLRFFSFSKNFGQSAAFAAGFEKARAPFVITLDGDGQNNPQDIPKLLSLIEGADLVVGWRVERRDPWQKRWISRFSNRIRSKLFQDGVHDSGCSLKVYRRDALLTLPRFRGMHRFLPALFLMGGFRVSETPVSHRERMRGATKYRFFNRLGPITDLLFVLWIRCKWLDYKIQESSHEDRSSRR